MRSRRVNAGKGRRALASELRTKGVDDDVIAAPSPTSTPMPSDQAAEQLVADKLRRKRLTDDTDDVKVARRLVGMLARRGYGQSMAFDVVKVALASERRTPPGLAVEVGGQAYGPPLFLVAGGPAASRQCPRRRWYPTESALADHRGRRGRL